MNRVWVTVAISGGSLLVGILGGALLSDGPDESELPRDVVAPSMSRPEARVRHASYFEVVRAFQGRAKKSAADRIRVLKAIDRWLAVDAVDCANGLYALRALGLIDSDALTSAFIDGGSSGVQMHRAKDIESPEARERVLGAVFLQSIEKDPMAALDLLDHLPPTQTNLAGKLGEALGKRADPELIRRALRHPSMTHYVITTAIQSWVGLDTTQALTFMEDLDEKELRRVNTWKDYIWDKLGAVGDPEARLQFLKNRPVSWQRESYETQAFGMILAENPDRWEEVIKRAGSPLRAGSIAAEAAARIVTKSPEAAAAFLLRIPGDEARREATRRTAREFIFKVAQRDVAQIVAWAKSIPDPVISKRILDEARFQRLKLPEGL